MITYTYPQCENEVLQAWPKYEPYAPMTETDQAIIVAAASRLLYNIRRNGRNTHHIGGNGAIELALKGMKALKLTPPEFAARQGEDDWND